MLRTALTPRWLALHALALALGAVGLQLGRWQFSVAHDTERQRAIDEVAARPVVPVEDVLTVATPFPDDGSGRRVTTSGEYVPSLRFTVPGRLLGGREGAWAVDVLRTEQRILLPVVRGWVPDADAPPPTPTGHHELTVSLAPSESLPDGDARLPTGQLPAVSLPWLVNVVPAGSRVYNAFGFALEDATVGGVVAGAPENPVRDAASTQAEADAKAGLEPVPPPAVATDLSWRNLMYALQWWAFAAFPLWMWWRMLSAAVRDEREAAAEAGVAPTVPAG